jgi:hypothetical protein
MRRLTSLPSHVNGPTAHPCYNQSPGCQYGRTDRGASLHRHAISRNETRVGQKNQSGLSIGQKRGSPRQPKNATKRLFLRSVRPATAASLHHAAIET